MARRGWRSSRGYEGYGGFGGWAPYVPVAARKRQAAAEVAALTKKGRTLSPVQIEGRKIARTFWGKAWCTNLESYSDYSNRLPRGRSYVRNGSVIDLQIAAGKITALVSGSSMYEVKIGLDPLPVPAWKAIRTECAGKIDSLVELLRGELSTSVMEVMTSKNGGLFPAPKQIRLSCSCPDGATMCKHVAAVLYGVGARFDTSPELFFVLRGVDKLDLLSDLGSAPLGKAKLGGRTLEVSDLSSVFGIELEASEVTEPTEPKKTGTKRTAKVSVVRALKPAKAATKPAPTPGAKRASGRRVRGTPDIDDARPRR